MLQLAVLFGQPAAVAHCLQCMRSSYYQVVSVDMTCLRDGGTGLRADRAACGVGG